MFDTTVVAVNKTETKVTNIHEEIPENFSKKGDQETFIARVHADRVEA